MTQIFISHAGADADVATRISQDLKNAGHETRVDTSELRLGVDSIEFMNQSIEDADVVLILHSKHTPQAVWQKLEVHAALWNEIAQEGGKCIIIRLDDTPLPPLLGPKVYGKLDLTTRGAYQKLLEGICTSFLPESTVSSIVSEAFRAESRNPFRRIRAEYFEDLPELLARTFAPPDALKMGALEDMKPCFLEGSRGTGKSMLLLSLRARNFLLRVKPPPDRHRIFGFYLKLSRGAVCNAGILSEDDSDPKLLEQETIQVTDVGSQELIVCLLESLVSEVAFCLRQSLVSCDRHSEKLLAESVHRALFGGSSICPANFDELLERLADAHRDIAAFIRRRFIYGESVPVPVATFDLVTFKRVINLLRERVPELKASMFVVLLDEYENLFPYQQRIVNGYIKLAAPHFSVKVAKKIGSADVSGTTTGQELQETHDYTRLPLIYDVQDPSQLAAYRELLRHMVANILRSEGLKVVDVLELLPQDTTSEVDPAKVAEEVAKLCKVKLAELNSWPEDKRREKMTYYGEAGVYRVLYGTKGRRGEKVYSGFADLSFVSSGVVRYFQEILSVAYYLMYRSPPSATTTLAILPDRQSKAVHFVSEHNLTTLSRNVERHGEALKYFLLDLGDCLRLKLLKHSSEPEAGRVTLDDPELLDQPDFEPLRRLLNIGIREGALQTREGRPAFKPKHRSDPQPAEFNICRIYAPVLQISPRLRWRTRVKTKVLLGLALKTGRSEALQSMKSEMVKVHSKHENFDDQPGLFPTP
jgi:hypothetical protein